MGAAGGHGGLSVRVLIVLLHRFGHWKNLIVPHEFTGRRGGTYAGTEGSDDGFRYRLSTQSGVPMFW